MNATPAQETSDQRGASHVGTSGGFGNSVFLANLHHMCAQTDGSYRFPNSREGDMLKTAKREIEQLLSDVAHWRVVARYNQATSLPNKNDVPTLAAGTLNPSTTSKL